MSDNDSDKDTIAPQQPEGPGDTGALEAEAPPKPFIFADENLDAQLAAAAKEQVDPEKAALYKKIGMIAAAVLAGFLLIYSLYACQPKKGSMAYGVCSTLLEMQTQYPNTLRHINVEGSATTVRIYFTSIDAFGQYKLEMYECKFGPGVTGGMQITDILRNRERVGNDFIDEANKILPAIVNSDPYRVMPPEWKNQLLDE